MKIGTITKSWIPIALLTSAIVSIILLGPTMKQNFAMPWPAIQIGAVIATFIIVLVIGPIMEQKTIDRFQKEKS